MRAHLAPLLQGMDAGNPHRVSAAMDARLPGYLDAKAAMEMACVDLLSRRLGVPVHQYLGGAVVLGYPFLTTHTAHLSLPLLGSVHVPSALFFDMGVFSIVLGSTMLILTALSHQSVRSHRWAEEQDERQASANAKTSTAGEPA